MIHMPTYYPAVYETMKEQMRQKERWGEQSHPDWTPNGVSICSTMPIIAKAMVDAKAAGRLTDALSWWDILYEEVMEAYEVVQGSGYDALQLREELIQIAAVCCSWVDDLDKKQGIEYPDDHFG